ncbi:MAG: hypothetical protein J0I19_02455 [Alphaproteobacteria bacterium]|nr:hypothetical protein [Alphaproteobacteria bacterium]
MEHLVRAQDVSLVTPEKTSFSGGSRRRRSLSHAHANALLGRAGLSRTETRTSIARRNAPELCRDDRFGRGRRNAGRFSAIFGPLAPF